MEKMLNRSREFWTELKHRTLEVLWGHIIAIIKHHVGFSRSGLQRRDSVGLDVLLGLDVGSREENRRNRGEDEKKGGEALHL